MEHVEKLITEIDALIHSLPAQMDCDIDMLDGDWGGQYIVVKVSPDSAAYIAKWLLKLIAADFDGKHFDIDKASIAPETDHQICFSLKK